MFLLTLPFSNTQKRVPIFVSLFFSFGLFLDSSKGKKKHQRNQLRRPFRVMAETPLRLVSTPLEVFSGSNESFAISSHNISTEHPHISTSHQPAIAFGCYTNNALALLSTPFEDQYILELRTFQFESSQQNNASIHRLLFPAPILNTVYFSCNENSNTLTLQVCLLSGVVYRVLLPLELLGSVDEIPPRWISEYQLISLGADLQGNCEQGYLSSFHTSKDGIVSLATCTDGRIIKIVWEQETGQFKNERLSGES